MPVLPGGTPTHIPLPAPNLTRTQQIAYYAGKLDGIYPGRNYGASYTEYCSLHLKMTAPNAFLVWQLNALTSGLGSVLKQTFTVQGQITAASASGAVTGLTSLNPIAGLFQGNIWMRVGEVVLGIVLIAIGVAELTHAVPIATTIAKAVK
jgi:hypothetical protein